MRDDRVRYFAQNMDILSRRDRVFLNNPVIMQGMGLAIIVVPATNIQNAAMIALGVILLMTPTRVLANFIVQHTKLRARAVVYALVAGILYAGVAYILDSMFGTATANVGIYLPLLVVEPLILKRYESRKPERVITSFKKGIITTIGFCLVLFLTAGLRELLAFGTLGGILIYEGAFLPMAALPAGGFILLGLLAALWRSLVAAFKKKISMGVKQLQ